MKIIVAGSRSIRDRSLVLTLLNQSVFIGTVDEVISGGAVGVDRLGEVWAAELFQPFKLFLPDWEVGKHAGILRNKDMADYADGLIAIWNGKSKGTQNMIQEMIYRRKPIEVRYVEGTGS